MQVLTRKMMERESLCEFIVVGLTSDSEPGAGWLYLIGI